MSEIELLDLSFDEDSQPYENEMNKTSWNKKEAKLYYEEAGEEVPEEEDELSLVAYGHLLNDDIHGLLQEVLEEVRLPFVLSDFQKLSLHCLGSKKNVILISPAGSGKMMVVYLGTLLMKKVLNKGNGVAICTQPLSIIMEEKMKSCVIPTGTISMKGVLKNSLGEETQEVELTDTEDKFIDGSLPCLIGHPESWMSIKGQSLLKKLHASQNIVLNCVDEMHAGLENHWGEIRPEMKSLVGRIRIFSSPGTPCLAMTATATDGEIDEIKDTLGLRNNVIILKASPIQRHVKYVAVKRPSNFCGFDGVLNIKNQFCPGLVNLLRDIYIDKFIQSVLNNELMKKCIFFFRTEIQMLECYEYLCEKLPHLDNEASRPFVMNHGAVGEATTLNILERRNEISLFLSTSKMLMGVDIADIQIVVFVRPQNKIHHIIQGGGRAGRRMGTGFRKKSLVYILYNNEDLGNNVPGLDNSVRDLVTSNQCLKKSMAKYFDMNTVNVSSDWCCSVCDNNKVK